MFFPKYQKTTLRFAEMTYEVVLAIYFGEKAIS
jgi:hypothetical protein